MDKSEKRRGRPVGTTEAAIIARNEAAGLDRYGLPLEPDPRGAVGKRLRPQHQDEVRAKIQSSKLVDMLQKNIAGELVHPITGEPYELSPGRIKSAEILLSKSLSSLQSTEVVSVNANDRMSESEILGKIAELLQADPRLVAMVGPGMARMPPASPDPLPPSDDCIVCGNAGLPGGCPACGADPADTVESGADGG